MEMKSWTRQCGLLLWIVVHLVMLTEFTVTTQTVSRNMKTQTLPVKLQILNNYVRVENGLFNVTFSTPQGMVTGIQYNGIDNLLEDKLNLESDRGYWDIVWSKPERPGDIYERLEGTSFRVIQEDEDQVELSFMKPWNLALDGTGIPLNIDRRFIVLRGVSGFYSYAIFERLKGWRDTDIFVARIAYKLRQNLFRYMAISDDRQRIMPTAQDRARSQPLDYPEAVLLTNPSDPLLKGEVDDKYQYSNENRNNGLHGWICSKPGVGFWMITPSFEFRTAGPFKQELTSHAGPVTLSMFLSVHYAGDSLTVQFRNGEPWKKVFGPVFTYLNSAPVVKDPRILWADAKQQMLREMESWPYNFPCSVDFLQANQRGEASGQLLVRDSYISKSLIIAESAYVGLALPGAVGSWQNENKGYQFWSKTDSKGNFLIENVHPGNYNLYAWIPGFIGDYKYELLISIKPGQKIQVGTLIYDPPRNGPTLWEIGIPDRTAAEFYVPNPNPAFVNKLYVNHDKFRQYGLWERYTELYPNQDLVYTIGTSNYKRDWFFAQVNRNVGNKTYKPTTWQILFDLTNVDRTRNYTLRLALASATRAEFQVRINQANAAIPQFRTGEIGRDNAIARHGIHGLYMLSSVDVSGSLLQIGMNTIFLTQSNGMSPFTGLMYDYIRLEQPPPINNNI